MAMKTCPKCKTKCGPRKRVCNNCKYAWSYKDDDDENVSSEIDDDDDDTPERTCSICKESFSPKITKKSISGDPYYIWDYMNYCSTGCYQAAEEILFNFVYELSLEQKIEIPIKIKEIVNNFTFTERKSDEENLNYCTFIQLLSPQVSRKNIPENIEIPPDFQKIEKPITSENHLEVLGRDPPPKRKAPPTNNETDDEDEDVEDENESSIEKKKPGKGKKCCPQCDEIVGARTRICEKCKYQF